jgi:hypothetical protein
MPARIDCASLALHSAIACRVRTQRGYIAIDCAILIPPGSHVGLTSSLNAEADSLCKCKCARPPAPLGAKRGANSERQGDTGRYSEAPSPRTVALRVALFRIAVLS